MVGLSALFLAGVIVVTAALGLGVRTTYGSGIDDRLGSQVQRDFLADQDAEAAALSKGDPGMISGRLTGNALQDVSQQITTAANAGAPPTVSFQAGSLTVLQAQDPIDPTLVIEVQEDGSKTVTSSAGPNSAPTEQTIAFHGDFWLRKDSSGRYLIADQKIQNLPTSILPAFALITVAVVWVGLAGSLVVLRRRAKTIPAPAAAGLTAAVAAVVDALLPMSRTIHQKDLRLGSWCAPSAACRSTRTAGIGRGRSMPARSQHLSGCDFWWRRFATAGRVRHVRR